MNTFTFDKKDQKQLQVSINEKMYTLNPYTLAVKTASEKFVKCQKPLIERFNNQLSEAEIERIVLQSCLLVKDTLNQVLGKGAYDKIFGDRSLDFTEHQKVVEFLFNEIAEFCKQNPISNQHESLA